MVAISRLNDITAIYRGDHNDLSLIYRFDARRFERYLADLSAINHGNKERYSAIITCITFAQYCISSSSPPRVGYWLHRALHLLLLK